MWMRIMAAYGVTYLYAVNVTLLKSMSFSNFSRKSTLNTDCGLDTNMSSTSPP
jgi:hypothetical protein